MTEQKLLLDTHTHSTLSFDAENEPREMIERAIELGLSVIASTEHLDVNLYYDKTHKNSVLIPKGNKIINDLKKEYKNDIKVIYGVEFAQGFHDPSLSEKLLSEFQFDYVLGSLHSLRDTIDFYEIKYKNLDVINLLERYFDEVYEMVSIGGFDALAHLAYPLRYIIGREGIFVDIRLFDEKIRKILNKLIEKNIALELNTGGLRTVGYERSEPDFYYLKVYYELGGRLLTLGSDAHRVSDLSKGLSEALGAAEQIGFNKLVYYENREPHFIKC